MKKQEILIDGCVHIIEDHSENVRGLLFYIDNFRVSDTEAIKMWRARKDNKFEEKSVKKAIATINRRRLND